MPTKVGCSFFNWTINRLSWLSSVSWSSPNLFINNFHTQISFWNFYILLIWIIFLPLQRTETMPHGKFNTLSKGTWVNFTVHQFLYNRIGLITKKFLQVRYDDCLSHPHFEVEKNDRTTIGNGKIFK